MFINPSEYLAVFWSHFLHRTNCERLFRNFFRMSWPILFFTQSEYFTWPLHCGHVPPFSKWSHFSNISGFLKPFFPENNFNVFVETFFRRFLGIFFLTQSDYFAWAIAFALWPCSAIFKIVLFFEY